MESTPSPAEPAAPPPAPQKRSWLRRLKANKASAALAAAVVAIYALCAVDPGTYTLKQPFAPSVLVKYGGYSWAAVRDQGEWWRLFTTLFVSNWGLDFIIFLWLCYELAPSIERVLGGGKFVVLFLLAGAGGVAIGELVQPTANVPGTMMTLYALLGALPGLALGRTGSLRKAAADPGARSAVFWLGLWLGIGYFMGWGWSLAGMIGAAALAAVLATGLASFGQRVGMALVFSGVGVAVAGGAVTAVAQGKRVLDGRLVDRGRPATRRPLAPELDEELDGGRDVRDDRAAAARAAQAVRAKLEPRLDQFGPLPSGHGLGDDDYVAVQEWLLDLERSVEDPSNGITGELDDLRVRCLLLLGRHQQAAALAEEMLTLQGTPRARALAGATFYFRGGGSRQQAVEELEGALVADPGLEQAWPEVRYYLGQALLDGGADGDAATSLRRYVEVTGEGPHPEFRRPLVERARAQLELLR